MSNSRILEINKAALVVVDIQEGFRNAVPDFALLASRASIAVRGFQTLGLPVIVTEQYPKGLGPTAEEIRFTLPDDFKIIEKTAFSASVGTQVTADLQDIGRNQIVLCGLETHVCVNQTAHDLLDQGFDVHILTDCVSSRFDHDKLAGLAKMQSGGVVPSSIEMALFELMRDARHPQFKAIQALIK